MIRQSNLSDCLRRIFVRCRVTHESKRRARLSRQACPEYHRDLWTTILVGRRWRGNFTNLRKDGSFYRDEHTATTVAPSADKSVNPCSGL